MKKSKKKILNIKKINNKFAITNIMCFVILCIVFSLAVFGIKKLEINDAKLKLSDKDVGNEINQEEVNNDDIDLAFVYVGSKETPQTLPGKGAGYYVQNVSCKNGTAKWSNDLWSLTNVSVENGKQMACLLTLGDTATYDDTIDQSFSNLKPENIVSGVQIGDIIGTGERQKTLIAAVYVTSANTYGDFYNGSYYIRYVKNNEWSGAVYNTTGRTLIASSFIAFSDCGFRINGVQYVGLHGSGNFSIISGNLGNIALQNVSGIASAMGDGENGIIYIFGEVR